MLDQLSRHDLRVGEVTAHAWVSDASERPDEPTFVLVHGLGVSSRYFEPLTQRLAPTGRVVLFDLPGFGRTPEPERPLGIEAFAAVVAGASDQLGVRDAVWLGHSMGSQIVVEALRRHPELGRAVALAAPVVTHGARTVPQQTWAFLRSALREHFGSALLSVEGYLRAGLVWPKEIMPAMMTFPLEERLTPLTQHVLLMRGSFEAVTPQSWLDELAEASRSAASVRIVTVAGAAHQLVVRHADVVAHELVSLAERSAR